MSTAVLIVNYRTYGDLHRCLGSFVPFLEPTDEIVVVDHESDRRALGEAVDVGVPITTLPMSDNLGFAAGVNLAAARSRAPFLLLVNPDTVAEGPVVRVLEHCLASQHDVAVAGARVHNVDGTVQATARRFPDVTTWVGGRSTWLSQRFPTNWLSRRNLIGRDATSPLDVDWLSGTCLMTRRDVFELVHGFDESFFLYWEDADYCSRVAAAGFRRVYVPAVSVRHVGGRSAEHDPVRAIRAFHQSAYRLYWKRAGPIGRTLAPLVQASLWLRGTLQAKMRNRTASAS
jgi:GT2 family glycosyltransferase